MAAQTAAGSRFVFPHFTAFADESSGIAVFNPNRSPAQVVFTLRNADGSLVALENNPATATVPALGQIARTAGQLFGDRELYASLEITSSSPGLLAFCRTFDPGMTYLDGSEAPTASYSLILPVIPGPDEGMAEIDVVNPNSRDTSVELRLWSFEGRLVGTATIRVRAGGFYRNLAQAAFPPGTDFSRASHITATSKPWNIFSIAQTVAATSLFVRFPSASSAQGNLDIAALNAVPVAETSNSAVIPYFRCGGSFASTLSLTNVEPAAATVSVTAVANDGTTLGAQSFSLNAQGGLRAPLQTVIPSLGSSEREGWLLIQSSGRIAGALIYGRSDKTSLAAVPMQKVPETGILFNHVVQGFGMHMDVSLVNPTPNTATAQAVVVAPDGTTVAANRITIGPNRRASYALDQLLPGLENQNGGVLYILANEPLFAAASLWSDAWDVALSVPVQAASFIPAPPSSFVVLGRILVNDEPASGFTIVLSGPVGMRAISGADGGYRFTRVPPGRYTMMVEQCDMEFSPRQVVFDIATENWYQDFVGFTDGVLVRPGSARAGSGDVTIDVYGKEFNSTSEVFAGTTRLHTKFVDSVHLQAILPAFLLKAPSSFEIVIVTDGSGGSRRVAGPMTFIVYMDRPVLAELDTEGTIVEGAPGGIFRLKGTGFLPGARMKVNGAGEGIVSLVLSDTEMLAYVPSTYFESGGIYPVTVENPLPANVESNILLLAVYFPAPAVESVVPNATPVRLEPGAEALNIEVLGYGFRRGSIVLFDGHPLFTTYCESDRYCLAVRLYAKVPAELLKTAGYAKIEVQNPAPSLACSQTAILRVEGLRPTITSVQAGSATLVSVPMTFKMPVVVNGTNFGPETMVRIYRAGEEPPDKWLLHDEVEIVGSTQLVVFIEVKYPDSLGEWKVEVANPGPGGGIAEAVSFHIIAGSFVPNPFLISMSPATVTAGGPSFTLTINGTNFKSGAVINFNYVPLITTVLSDRQVRAEVPSSLIRSAGRIPISVTNQDTGGTSNRLFLDIR
jgi:hypothetical protein